MAPSQVSSAEWEATTPILASLRLYFSRLPRTSSLLIMINPLAWDNPCSLITVRGRARYKGKQEKRPVGNEGSDGKQVVASRRFELRSQDPESRMIDHYTTRLSKSLISFLLIKLSCCQVWTIPRLPGLGVLEPCILHCQHMTSPCPGRVAVTCISRGHPDLRSSSVPVSLSPRYHPSPPGP